MLPVSRFGLVEITRQRVRPEMAIKTAEVCPTCKGTGEVQAAITIVDEIENNMRALMEEQKVPKLTIAAHPLLQPICKRASTAISASGLRLYKKWVNIKPKTAMTLLDYEFLDKDGKEILF